MILLRLTSLNEATRRGSTFSMSSTRISFFFLFFSFFFWLRSARNNLSMTSSQSNLNGFIPIRYYSLSWPWMWQQSTYRLKSKKSYIYSSVYGDVPTFQRICKMNCSLTGKTELFCIISVGFLNWLTVH